MRKIMFLGTLFASLLASTQTCPTDAADLADGGSFSGDCGTYTGPITLTGNVDWVGFGGSGSFTVSGDMTISGGRTLTINFETTVTINGNLVLNGDAVINGNLIVNGNVTLNGASDLGGNGYLTYSGTFTDGGGANTSGAFTNCPGSGNCGDPTLPVELIQFNAEFSNETGSTFLNWSTASELNNYGFDVQHSVDASNWRVIGFVEGHGTTTEKKTYSFEYVSAHKNGYYRLKQIDYDGQFEYLPIVFLSSETIKVPIEIYPNPTTSDVTLKGPSGEYFTIQVYDLSGNDILRFPRTNLNEATKSLNTIIPSLKKGVYFVQFSNPSGHSAIRFTKK